MSVLHLLIQPDAAPRLMSPKGQQHDRDSVPPSSPPATSQRHEPAYRGWSGRHAAISQTSALAMICLRRYMSDTVSPPRRIERTVCRAETYLFYISRLCPPFIHIRCSRGSISSRRRKCFSRGKRVTLPLESVATLRPSGSSGSSPDYSRLQFETSQVVWDQALW